MMIVLVTLLIVSIGMLAMLIIKLKFDIQRMYDKYQWERVKRLDERRQHELVRPYTTRTEYYEDETIEG
jgi:Tfp pilus assembly protein PilV